MKLQDIGRNKRQFQVRYKKKRQFQVQKVRGLKNAN